MRGVRQFGTIRFTDIAVYPIDDPLASYITIEQEWYSFWSFDLSLKECAVNSRFPITIKGSFA